MWGIIIATVTGTGIGLSFHIFHHWYKHYKTNKKINQQKLIESTVIEFLKQLQTNEQPNGDTTTDKKEKKS